MGNGHSIKSWCPWNVLPKANAITCILFYTDAIYMYIDRVSFRVFWGLFYKPLCDYVQWCVYVKSTHSTLLLPLCVPV